MTDETSEAEQPDRTFNDRILILILSFLFGFGVMLISLGSIALAFYQWKFF